MTDNRISPPSSNELEVSVFGPGYGEALVLHIGNGAWLLIDSCVFPGLKQPAPIDYLLSLGVDYANAVKVIVATHWHDDHVRGLSNLVRECKAAKLVVSEALRTDEFLQLVSHYRPPLAILNSGLDEIPRTFQILDSRRRAGSTLGTAKNALVDRVLYVDEFHIGSSNIHVSVSALSPSDYAVQSARLKIADLLPKRKSRLKRIIAPSRNDFSIVLWLEIGSHRVLLGADLENADDPGMGWTAILEDSVVVQGKQASFFKIPHHGSRNGHDDRVWSQLLERDPVAVLSPWTKGAQLLPLPTDIQRIAGFTSNGYATAPPSRKRTKWRNRVVSDTVTAATRSMHAVGSRWGHVRVRRQIDDVNSDWEVELFGDAYALND
ncbi:MAG: MBL fold metallo-hydrolase [Anaerolineales bacterium]